MFTQWLMYPSSIVLGLSGIIMLFFPDYVLHIYNGTSGNEVLIQLAAAGFLAMAVLHWMGRNAIYGSIYGKPITMANFVSGVILTTSLFSHQVKYDGSIWDWIFFIIFCVYMLGFVKIIFFPEKSKLPKQ